MTLKDLVYLDFQINGCILFCISSLLQSTKQTDTRKFPVKSKDTIAQETKGFNQVEGFQIVGHKIDTNAITEKIVNTPSTQALFK